MSDKIFIDTNVFLRFLILDEKNPQMSIKAKEIFALLQDGKIILQSNALIVAEIVYVLESYYELHKSPIKDLLLPILSIPNLLINSKENILAALNTFAEKNVDFEDACTYFDMVNEGISKIITFDEKHFSRFENISIVSSCA